MREALPKFAYCPFGGGPRICPGGEFSLREATMILRGLFENAEFEPVGDHPPQPFEGLTLKPNNGTLELRVNLREGPYSVSRARR
jgi:cytochrome P450